MTTNRYEVTMLVAGTYKGIHYSKREIALAASSMTGRPVNLNHSEDVEDIVGHVVNARAENGALVGVIQLNPNSPKYAVAKAHLDHALSVGATPNVSIEGKFFRKVEDGKARAEDLEFTALGIVARGACSDRAGCGVMRSTLFDRGNTMTETTTTETASVSASVPNVTIHNYIPEKAALAEKVAEKLGAPVKESAKLCACSSQPAETAELSEKLNEFEAKVAALEKEKSELAAERDALLDEKTRAPLVAKLAELAPDYKTEGKTAAQLADAVEAAESVRAPAVAKRKSMLADGSEEPDAKTAFLNDIRAQMGL